MSLPKVTVEENPDPGLRAEILKPLRAFMKAKWANCTPKISP